MVRLPAPLTCVRTLWMYPNKYAVMMMMMMMMIIDFKMWIF